ncbi:hypothetical protein Pd630_LPD11054 (plasmid) [Rhodococcus opacus PD630]|nr:hypothetical protein Pd630_LPD11054 [Rhodococcus opacus PD630]
MRRRCGACSACDLHTQLMLGLAFGYCRRRPRLAEPAAGPGLSGEHIVDFEELPGVAQQKIGGVELPGSTTHGSAFAALAAASALGHIRSPPQTPTKVPSRRAVR